MKTRKINDATIIFNTNAQYADEGQIIIARKYSHNHVLFFDITRGLFGLIQYCDLNAVTINRCYINNDYSLGVTHSDTRELEALGRQHDYLVSLLTADEDTVCEEA